MFAFATDLADEGMETVLDNVQERAGVDELTLGVAYHAARDIFPHDPVRTVRYLEGGAVFFQPDWKRYEGLRLQPHPSELTKMGDPLGDLCDAAGQRDLGVNAWIVFLHSDRLGFEHPECATRNALGDRYLTDLCPANPEVRAYVRALASDVAGYGVSNIFAESLHYHGLGHGYHHERYFEELGTAGTFMLGLCFCDHCMEAANLNGIDADAVHYAVRDDLRHRLETGAPEGDSGELTRGLLENFAGERLLAYSEVREGTVNSLVEEISEEAGDETKISFLDLSGAEKGFATGEPEGGATIGVGWQMGVDAASLADACDTLVVTGYASDPSRLASDLDAYQAVVPGPSDLGLLLRPMPPDCRSGENLAEKVELARGWGFGRIDFYHYGFCRLGALDWVRTSLARA